MTVLCHIQFELYIKNYLEVFYASLLVSLSFQTSYVDAGSVYTLTNNILDSKFSQANTSVQGNLKTQSVNDANTIIEQNLFSLKAVVSFQKIKQQQQEAQQLQIFPLLLTPSLIFFSCLKQLQLNLRQTLDRFNPVRISNQEPSLDPLFVCTIQLSKHK